MNEPASIDLTCPSIDGIVAWIEAACPLGERKEQSIQTNLQSNQTNVQSIEMNLQSIETNL